MESWDWSIKNKEYLIRGYSFRYLSYEDIINTESHLIRKIPNKIKTLFNITDDNTIIHPVIINLLKNNIDSAGKLSIQSRPVVQESTDGKLLGIYSCPAIARKELKLSRQTIENVLCGKHLTADGYRFRYLELNDIALECIDDEDKYVSPLAPLPPKQKPVGKNPTKNIFQIDLDGKMINKFKGFKAAGDWIIKKHNLENKPIHKPINRSAIKYKDNKHSVSNGYMWCYEEDYVEGKYADKVYEIFPDLENYNGNVNYDVIRKYFMLKKRPIWQIALDGTRVNRFDSKDEAVRQLEDIKIESASIGKCLQDSNFGLLCHQ